MPNYKNTDILKEYKINPTLTVVTGSTDGIGRSYAEQLAKKGMNLVLISRSAEKLNIVAKEISLQCLILISVYVSFLEFQEKKISFF